jgi:hypothetical protein
MRSLAGASFRPAPRTSPHAKLGDDAEPAGKHAGDTAEHRNLTEAGPAELALVVGLGVDCVLDAAATAPARAPQPTALVPAMNSRVTASQPTSTTKPATVPAMAAL